MKCFYKDKIFTFIIEETFHFIQNRRPFSCIYLHINHGNEGGIQNLLLHVEFDAWKCMFTFGWGTMVVTQKKHTCCNPSLGVMTKCAGLQGCRPRGKPESHISCSRECRRLWGNELSHSQVSSHFGNRSPNGLPKF